MALRAYTTSAKRSLKIGLLPADGIGREVIPVDKITFDRSTFLAHPNFPGCA